MMTFYDSAHAANVGKLVRAAKGLSNGKDQSKYLDTLRGISTTVVPEDVWRDVLVIAYEHEADTNTVTENALTSINTVLKQVFPDSSFAVSDQRPALYNSVQRNVLETVAAACPYEYGPGVYMARAMLSKADTAIYTGINDCEKGPAATSGKWAGEEEGGEQADIERAEEYSVNVYPNPSSGFFTVDLNIANTDVSTLRVWSLTGQLVFNESLSSGINLIDVDATNGLYLYVITVNETTKWSGKLAISKQQ